MLLSHLSEPSFPNPTIQTMKMVGVFGILKLITGLKINNRDKEMFEINSKVMALLVSNLTRLSFKNDLRVSFISLDPR
jgi:hypothetical protein